MISNEKYLILNLVKGPKFIFTSLVKPYTTFKRSNFIGKVLQKTAILLHRHDSKTRHQVLTCVFFPQLQCDMLLSHSFDIIHLKKGWATEVPNLGALMSEL